MHTEILWVIFLEMVFGRLRKKKGRIILKYILGNRLKEWKVDGTGSGSCLMCLVIYLSKFVRRNYSG